MAEAKKKEVKKTTTTKKEETNKTMTGLDLQWEVVLVYIIGILGFIFAFMKDSKVSKTARFHYKQSGVLFIITLGVSIIYRIIAGIFALMFITTAGLGVMSIVFNAIFGTIYGVIAIAILEALKSTLCPLRLTTTRFSKTSFHIHNLVYFQAKCIVSF